MPTDVLSPIPPGDKPAAASFQPARSLEWPPPHLRLSPRERVQILGRILRLALQGHAGDNLDHREADLVAMATLAADLLDAIECLGRDDEPAASAR
jgi:hypothetical protein